MTSRDFVTWVEPVARELLESRRQIAELARHVPDDAWSQPSPLDGWTYKDLLAHLASGDWVCQTVLGAVTGREPVDVKQLSSLGFVDEGNARRLEERKQRSVPELIAEVEAGTEHTQDLLAMLTEAQESLKSAEAPITLGEYLRGFPGHDRTHLEELRTALAEVTASTTGDNEQERA